MFPPHLETERLTLRRPHLTDALEIYQAYASNPRVTRYLSWPTHRSVSDAEQFLRQLDEAIERRAEFAWVIAQRSQGRIAGCVGLRIAGDVGTLGYCIAEEIWGQGYALEAVNAVLPAVWSRPEIRRLEAYCHVHHLRSARVLEKAGLRYVGLERAHVRLPAFGPHKQDVLQYALSRRLG